MNYISRLLYNPLTLP